MPPENEKKLPSMRTFHSDANDFMQERKLSPLGAATYTYINQQKTLPESAPRPFKKILIAVIFIVVLGGGIFAAVRSIRRAPTETEPATTGTSLARTLVSVDEKKEITFSSANPGSLVSAIEKERAYPLRQNGILHLALSLTTKEFAALLGWAPPQSFLGQAKPQFNILVVQHIPKSDLALIIPTQSFEETFASLLQWERTMWLDWKQFIAPEQIQNINQFKFQDEIVRNNDARVLRDAQGSAILAYAIFNKKFVVIATSRESLGILLQKLIELPPQ